MISFLLARYPVDLPLRRRLDVLARFIRTTNGTRCWHSQAELLTVCDAILRRAGRPDLVVVEAGAGKGASTAKLSIAVSLVQGQLHVFDSFRGLPPNDERHVRLDGSGPVVFRQGAFDGSLPAVRRAVERYGVPAVCDFRKGWFAETLPRFDGAVDVALLDVDLLASTRTCLVHLYPRLRPGGVIFTQDAHLRAIAQLIGNPAFWRDDVGVPPPLIEGLGVRKLVAIHRK